MYVLIEEDAGYITKISGPGTIEQLRAMVPDGLMEHQTDEGYQCWWGISLQQTEISYTIMPLTPLEPVRKPEQPNVLGFLIAGQLAKKGRLWHETRDRRSHR